MKARRERPKRSEQRGNRRQLTDDFVRVSRSVVGLAQDYIIKVGTAILGGDLTGNARGDYAIDIQTDRLSGAGGETQVAAGDYAVQIGALNTVLGGFGVRIGYGGAVTGESGIGIGTGASASGENGVAIGQNSNASGDDSVALGGATILTEGSLGIGATARLLNAEHVFNTGVAPIIKRAAGLQAEANWPRHLAGPLTLFTSGVLDLKSAGVKTLALPDGCKIWLVALGLICIEAGGLTVQPTIRFGATFDDDKYVDDRQTTQLTAAGKREHYLPEILSDPETEPNITVVTGATATTLTARAYWIGILLEDE